jgi:hypothetical protein
MAKTTSSRPRPRSSRPSFDLLETMRVDTGGVVNVERHLAASPRVPVFRFRRRC